jgi:hypothetical protein
MGSMSASDAAPLPRLGEVFFDVRGNSRSMRLSWYADTGVAVFSIWQGGTCTGTFRLPMDDLERMIEALRRGPKGQRGQREAPGEATGGQEAVAARGGPGAGQPGAPEPGQATVSMRRPDGPSGTRREDSGERAYPAGPGDRAYPAGAGDHAGDRAYPAGAGDSGAYPADLLGSGYPGDQPAAGYHDGASGGFPPAGGNGGFPPPGGYPDVPSTGDYRRDPAPAGYDEDYHQPGPEAGYPAGPDYGAEHGYPDTGGYPGTGPGYPEGPATGDYRPGQSGGHRRDAGYPADPEEYRRAPGGSHRRDPGYPAGPGYPQEGPPRYSRPPGMAEYPGEQAPAGSGGYPAGPDYEQHGEEWDDTDDHSLGGYAAPPPPESHPYGRSPANREDREHGRYPGRH